MPSPSNGCVTVSPNTTLATKIMINAIMQDRKVTKVELAKRMDIASQEVHRILDPQHKTKMDRLEQALTALDIHINISFDIVEPA